MKVLTKNFSGLKGSMITACLVLVRLATGKYLKKLCSVNYIKYLERLTSLSNFMQSELKKLSGFIELRLIRRGSNTGVIQNFMSSVFKLENTEIQVV